MKQVFTCIICPNSCEIEVSEEGITGALCRRGVQYVQQELTDPRRNIATTVAVQGGAEPLVSVRLTAPIPKARIMEAAEAIHALQTEAPVKAGTVLAHDLLGLGADVIATKSVEKR